MEYGEDLWDSLHVIQMQVDIRGKQLRAIKSFFKSYKNSLDFYNQSIDIALKKLGSDLELPTLKGGVSTEGEQSTFTTAFLQMKDSLEVMVKVMQDKASQIQMDLIDGLDLFDNDYNQTNEKYIKAAQDIWDKMYTERTNMLFNKEEYLNNSHTYCQLKKKSEAMQLAILEKEKNTGLELPEFIQGESEQQTLQE